MTLYDKFWFEFEKVADEFRNMGCLPPYPNKPPVEIEDMEYREDFGFNYDLYLEELNKSKRTIKNGLVLRFRNKKGE